MTSCQYAYNIRRTNTKHHLLLPERVLEYFLNPLFFRIAANQTLHCLQIKVWLLFYPHCAYILQCTIFIIVSLEAIDGEVFYQTLGQSFERE